MRSNEIRAFCSEKKIELHGLLLSSLDNASCEFVVEIVSHLVRLAKSGILGAVELLEELAKSDPASLESSRHFENLLTEAFAAWFLETRQRARIKAYEAKAHPLHSPNARNKSKSCDLVAELKGLVTYFEVKDFSADFEPSRTTGRRGYTPAPDAAKRKWLEKQVRESLNKGANYLIARLPVWESSDAIGLDALRQVLDQHHMIASDHAHIEVAFNLPDWFRGIFLIKRNGHVFVSISEKVHS